MIQRNTPKDETVRYCICIVTIALLSCISRRSSKEIISEESMVCHPKVSYDTFGVCVAGRFSDVSHNRSVMKPYRGRKAHGTVSTPDSSHYRCLILMSLPSDMSDLSSVHPDRTWTQSNKPATRPTNSTLRIQTHVAHDLRVCTPRVCTCTNTCTP